MKSTRDPTASSTSTHSAPPSSASWLALTLRLAIASAAALVLAAAATTARAADPATSSPTAEELLAEMLAAAESGSVLATTGSATAVVSTSDDGVTVVAAANPAQAEGTCGVGSGPRCCPWKPEDCTEKVAAVAAIDTTGDAVFVGAAAASADPPDECPPECLVSASVAVVASGGPGDPLKGIKSGAVAVATGGERDRTAIAASGADAVVVSSDGVGTDDEPAGIIVCTPRGGFFGRLFGLQNCFEFTPLPTDEFCLEPVNAEDPPFCPPPGSFVGNFPGDGDATAVAAVAVACPPRGCILRPPADRAAGDPVPDFYVPRPRWAAAFAVNLNSSKSNRTGAIAVSGNATDSDTAAVEICVQISTLRICWVMNSASVAALAIGQGGSQGAIAIDQKGVK